MELNSILNKRPFEGFSAEANKKSRTSLNFLCEESKPFAIPSLPKPWGRVGILYAGAATIPVEIWVEIMGHLLRGSVVDFQNLSQCDKRIHAISKSSTLKKMFDSALIREKPIVIQRFASKFLKTVDSVAEALKYKNSAIPENLFYLNFPENSPKSVPATFKKRIERKKGDVKILELSPPFLKIARLRLFQNVERLILDFKGESFSHRKLQAKQMEKCAPRLKVLHVKNAIIKSEDISHNSFRRLMSASYPDALFSQALSIEKLVFEDCLIGQAGLNDLIAELPPGAIEMISRFEDRKMIRLFASPIFQSFEDEIHLAAQYVGFAAEEMRELDFTAIKARHQSDRRLGTLPIFHAQREFSHEYQEWLNAPLLDRELRDLPASHLRAVVRHFYTNSYPELRTVHLRWDQIFPSGIKIQRVINECERFKAVAPKLRTFVIHKGSEPLTCSAKTSSLTHLFLQFEASST